MRRFAFQLIPLLLAVVTAPAAIGAEEAGLPPLECKEDSPPGPDPYKGMKERLREEVERDYPLLRSNGVTTAGRSTTLGAFKHSLGKICRRKNEFLAAATALDAKAASAQELGACDAFRAFETDYHALHAASVSYSEDLAKERESLSQKVLAGSSVEKSDIREKGKEAELKDSFALAWGLVLDDAEYAAMPEEEKARIARSSHFNRPLLQIHAETQAARKRVDDFSATYANIRTTNQSCASVDDSPDEQDRITRQRWNRRHRDDDPLTREPDPKNLVTVTTGYDNPPAPEEKSGPGKFISDHKGALIVGGVGAAAVGGLLLYKKHQDKKEQQEFDIQMLSLQRAHDANLSAGGGSGAGSGNAEGRTLSITGAPASAKKGQKLTPIAVSVMDKDGKPVNDSGIAITVSCTNSCSINGTLTRSTESGKAEFNDLVINSVHDGIQLRFSASGMDSVMTPGSFAVTE